MTTASLIRRRPSVLHSLQGLFLTRLLRKSLPTLRHGALVLHTPDEEVIGHKGSEAGPEAVIHCHSWAALRRLVTGGDVGFAESYCDGEWDSPDLVAVLAFGAANLPAVNERFSAHFLARLLRRIAHRRHRNSKRGARRNIMAHYDLGNGFYRLWLDESMMYSSALSLDDGETLETAQIRRLDHIATQLDLRAGQSVLEIGCGWGGLACHLAARADIRLRGLTLSPSQLAYGRAEVAKKGLEDRVLLELCDYRDVHERYDRIVSIEMFEAVGEAYWNTYFSSLKKALKPDGMALLQVITIKEDRFEAYRRSPDFIQTHIFPGGMLPSRERLEAAAVGNGLTLSRVETFGQSYAATLREWRKRFLNKWQTIHELGFDDRFRRLWIYYLAYCEAGFDSGFIDVGLYTFRTSSQNAEGH